MEVYLVGFNTQTFKIEANILPIKRAWFWQPRSFFL